MSKTSRRVFDDESDRWIAVLEGETDRDALLRARRDGAASTLPPRRTTVDPATPRFNSRLAALKVICVGGLAVGVLVLVVAVTSFIPGEGLERMLGIYITGLIGTVIAALGVVAGLLATAVGAVRHRD